MQKFLKVTDHPHLLRDSKSKAILNTDNVGLDQYRKQSIREKKIENIINEFDDVKLNLLEIKTLLTKLTEQVST
jgi:hypothetical protein